MGFTHSASPGTIRVFQNKTLAISNSDTQPELRQCPKSDLACPGRLKFESRVCKPFGVGTSLNRDSTCKFRLGQSRIKEPHDKQGRATWLVSKPTGLISSAKNFGPKTGTPVLLIMGPGARLTRWPLEFVEILTSRGYRVIRHDNRDVGLPQTF